MGILQTLLKEIKTDDKLEQIRILCDQIFQEEMYSIEHKTIVPKGPNLFLTLEVPGRTSDEIAFLSLEREFGNTYLSVLFVTSRKEVIKSIKDHSMPSIKRQKVWEINDYRPEKILTEYSKHYKFLRGE